MSVLKDVTSNGANIATEATLAGVALESGGNLDAIAAAVAGAATEATAASIDGKLPSLVGGRVPVDGSGVTQPVSGTVTVGSITASSAPLPTGAATETTLASIDGKLPALSGGRVPVSLASLPALAAGSATIGAVTRALNTSSPWSSATIGALSSGNTTLVAGAGGQTIKVYGWNLALGGAASVKFTDGAGGSDLTGAYPLVANQGLALGPLPDPLFVLSANTALVINSTAAVSAGGIVWYVRS